MAIQLTALFEGSTSLLLAYAVPLLLISALLTSSGAFLTLDRTRTFQPRSNETHLLPGGFEKKLQNKRWAFRLDGGVGGLAIGYVFGLHAATFLALLIMNETSTSPLSPTTFLLVWLFSVLPPVVLGGRWKVAALSFLGMSTGISLSLALCIITHPSLAPRIILTSVVTPLMTLIVVLPSSLPSLSQSRLAHSTARMASSCLGAFSMTVSVALLTRSSSSYPWANIWERLWVSNGIGWGTAREKGFDALFCVLWASGALSDWALNRWIGEDPDEKWDTYLTEYSATLPNARDREGNFVPLQSWWTRLLHKLHFASSSPARPHEIIFPTDKDFSMKADYAPVPGTLLDAKPAPHLSREDLQRSVSPAAYNWEPPISAKSAGVLQKGKARREVGFKSIFRDDASDADIERTPFDLSRRPTCLQKTKSARKKRRWHRLNDNKRRAPIEFKPKMGFSSDSDTEASSDDDQLKTPLRAPYKDVYGRAPRLVRVDSGATALSGTTVRPSSSTGHDAEGADMVNDLNVDVEKARIMNMKATMGRVAGASGPVRTAPEYSDVEEDVTAAYSQDSQGRYDTSGWKPEFLKRAFSSGSAGALGHNRLAVRKTSTPPAGTVPMTASLVHALGRLAKAQIDAYGPHPNGGVATNPAITYHGPPDSRQDHITIRTA